MKSAACLLLAMSPLLTVPSVAAESPEFFGMTEKPQLQTIAHGCRIVGLQQGITEVARVINVPAAQESWQDAQAQDIANELKGRLQQGGFQGGVEFREHFDQVGGGAVGGSLYVAILWTASAIGVNVQCGS